VKWWRKRRKRLRLHEPTCKTEASLRGEQKKVSLNECVYVTLTIALWRTSTHLLVHAKWVLRVWVHCTRMQSRVGIGSEWEEEEEEESYAEYSSTLDRGRGFLGGRKVSESFCFLLCLHTGCIRLQAHADLTHTPSERWTNRSSAWDDKTFWLCDEIITLKHLMWTF